MYKVQWLTLTEINTALTHMDTVFYLHTLVVLLYKDQWLTLTELNKTEWSPNGIGSTVVNPEALYS